MSANRAAAAATGGGTSAASAMVERGSEAAAGEPSLRWRIDVRNPMKSTLSLGNPRADFGFRGLSARAPGWFVHIDGNAVSQYAGSVAALCERDVAQYSVGDAVVSAGVDALTAARCQVVLSAGGGHMDALEPLAGVDPARHPFDRRAHDAILAQVEATVRSYDKTSASLRAQAERALGLAPPKDQDTAQLPSGVKGARGRADPRETVHAPDVAMLARGDAPPDESARRAAIGLVARDGVSTLTPHRWFAAASGGFHFVSARPAEPTGPAPDSHAGLTTGFAARTDGPVRLEGEPLAVLSAYGPSSVARVEGQRCATLTGRDAANVLARQGAARVSGRSVQLGAVSPGSLDRDTRAATLRTPAEAASTLDAELGAKDSAPTHDGAAQKPTEEVTVFSSSRTYLFSAALLELHSTRRLEARAPEITLESTKGGDGDEPTAGIQVRRNKIELRAGDWTLTLSDKGLSLSVGGEAAVTVTRDKVHIARKGSVVSLGDGVLIDPGAGCARVLNQAKLG